MLVKERYLRVKEELLNDTSINSKNRETIREFLRLEEYKLKRKQGLSEVDERSYKTLYFYIGRLKNLNIWFENKDWGSLTEKEITNLIDDLEDGKIKTKKGTNYSDRSLYYQMLGGMLFEIIGKADISKKFTKKYSVKLHEARPRGILRQNRTA